MKASGSVGDAHATRAAFEAACAGLSFVIEELHREGWEAPFVPNAEAEHLLDAEFQEQP